MKEEMTYVFLDIEWNSWMENQVNYSEALQLGCIICDEELHEKKNIFRIISPEHLDNVSDDTLKLMHLNKLILQQAKNEQEVINNFVADIPGGSKIVVWSEESADIFERLLEKYEYRVKYHSFIILKNFVSEIFGRNISMKDALTSFEIPVEENYLHCSKHDVMYLRKLYIKVQELLDGKMTETFVHAKNSKILHINGCHYAGKILNDKIQTENYHLLLQGYRICNCCKKQVQVPKMTYSKFAKKKTAANHHAKKTPFQYAAPENQFYEEEIQKMCKHLKLKCSISDRMIFVQSRFGHWRIQHDYEKVKNVYHENLRVDIRMDYKAQKMNHGFHEQKGINKNSLAKVLQYIAGHDNGIAKGTYYKKSRIDILFEQIAKENTAGV